MNHAGMILGSPFGSAWPARKPATPLSRSIHQKQFARPIHQIVFLPRPDGPASIVRKPAYVQPCGGLPGCG
jgi:hypothetical protein